MVRPRSRYIYNFCTNDKKSNSASSWYILTYCDNHKKVIQLRAGTPDFSTYQVGSTLVGTSKY